MEFLGVLGDKSNVTWLGYYKNKFEMSFLPSLARVLGYYNFQYFGEVRLEGIIALKCVTK